MFKVIINFLIVLTFFLNTPYCAATKTKIDSSEIAVSIKPIHSIVCAITKGITEPTLLVNGNFSPHNFQITPSQVMAIKNAKVIIWIGPSYARPLQTYLQEFKGKILCLQDSKKIKFLPLRNGTFWDHESQCSHHDHTANGMSLDGHIWLDPNMIIQVIDVVLDYLSAAYPAYKKEFKQNADVYRKRIQALHKELKEKMQTYKGKTYIIQHDGNQYFDNAFGTKTIATISIDPSIPPCAGHMLKLRQAVKNEEIYPECLFSEAQLDEDLAKSYAETLGIHCGTLDYLGISIEPGEYAYEDIMRAYVDAFIAGMEGKEIEEASY